MKTETNIQKTITMFFRDFEIELKLERYDGCTTDFGTLEIRGVVNVSEETLAFWASYQSWRVIKKPQEEALLYANACSISDTDVAIRQLEKLGYLIEQANARVSQ